MTNKPRPHDAPVPGMKTSFATELDNLMDRLHGEARLTVEMLEMALDAFRSMDKDAARATRRKDSDIDREEVHIEEETVRLIALHQPVALDLRKLTLIIKVNADLERIADHATGVCKCVIGLLDTSRVRWPASLLEMADRMVPRAHEAVRALQSKDAKLAEQVVRGDETMDRLWREAFGEIEQGVEKGDLTVRAALFAHRAGRELERIGDLWGAICEDIIYMQTGRIIRHDKSFKGKA